MKQQDLRIMSLHQEIKINENVSCMRVPWGVLYTTVVSNWANTEQFAVATTFVDIFNDDGFIDG